MKYTLKQKLSHFFHVVSNVSPITWICLYILAAPIFALIYWALPADQFRLPDGESTHYGTWLYYSIVTISTLGFGDYTPMHGGAQAITAIEVMCGLIFLGLFLNAVGAMKSEIDVESEIEKQKMLHFNSQKERLLKSIPSIIHSMNVFLAYCYAVSTPLSRRDSEETVYNPDFKFSDMADLFKPSGIPIDRTNMPVVTRLIKSANQTCLAVDSLQSRIDLTLWPEILEDCFGFVANCQMFANTDVMFSNPDHIIIPGMSSDATVKEMEESLSKEIESFSGEPDMNVSPKLQPIVELYYFIKETASCATRIEVSLTKVASIK